MLCTMPENHVCTGVTAEEMAFSGSVSREESWYIVRDNAMMPIMPSSITLTVHTRIVRRTGCPFFFLPRFFSSAARGFCP